MKTHAKILLALCLCLGLLAGCKGGGGKTTPAPGQPRVLQTLAMGDVEQRFASNKNLGRVTVVMFWATWCPACKSELPVLEQLRAKYPADKLDVMAVSVDDTERAMTDFLKTRPLALDVYLSKAEVGSEFGVRSIPVLYIQDKGGQVAFNSAGTYPFEMLDALIGRLVKG